MSADPDELEDPREILRELLEEIVDGLGLEADVHVSEGQDSLTGSVEGQDVGLLIGRRGQTIDAVQHLAQRIVFGGAPAQTRVIIDADGYRARRAEALCSEAERTAEHALRSGHPVAMEPMPPSERRVVHEYLRDRGGVETYSEGDEPERRLIVAPARG